MTVSKSCIAVINTGHSVLFPRKNFNHINPVYNVLKLETFSKCFNGEEATVGI